MDPSATHPWSDKVFASLLQSMPFKPRAQIDVSGLEPQASVCEGVLEIQRERNIWTSVCYIKAEILQAKLSQVNVQRTWKKKKNQNCQPTNTAQALRLTMAVVKSHKWEHEDSLKDPLKIISCRHINKLCKSRWSCHLSLLCCSKLPSLSWDQDTDLSLESSTKGNHLVGADPGVGREKSVEMLPLASY